MTARFSFAWLCIVSFTCACAPRAEHLRHPKSPVVTTADALPEIPVKRVRFFESGIAEYERFGPVARGIVVLRVPRSHLDDVLQTLVVRRNQAPLPVFSVDFESVLVPAAAQAQAHLLSESPDGQAYLSLLLNLKGERIEVVTDRSRETGRVVEVSALEAKPEPNKAGESPRKVVGARGKTGHTHADRSTVELRAYELTLLTDSADILRIHSDRIRRLRPLDERLAARMKQAIAARSSFAERVSAEIRIAVEPGSPVSLSYVTEAPLYGPNYRLTLQGSDKASLQGWALVHNDTDEPWDSVSIELSNGEPDSSVVPLAAPRYSERPIGNVTVAQSNLLPQLFGSSADTLSLGLLVANKSTNDRETSLVKRAPKLTSKGASSSALITPASSPKPIALGRSSYVYTVRAPTNVSAHSSALLPFVDIPVKSERGVWFAQKATTGKSTVRLENDTASPIPAGLLTVIEGEHYCGAGEIPELEPGHWGFFEFGTELGLSVKYTEKDSAPTNVQTVTWKDDALHVTVREHSEQSISITSTSKQGLVAYLAVSALDGAVIKGADRVETTGARPIAVAIRVPAHAQLERRLITEQSRPQTLDVESLDLDLVVDASKNVALPVAIRKVLQAAIVELNNRERLQTHKEQVEQEIALVEAAVERLPSPDSEHAATSLVAARLLQLESQRLNWQRTNDQLDKALEGNVSSIKRILSGLPQR